MSSLKDFEILHKLGDGSFSTVFKVLRKSDSEFYALKRVKLSLLNSREKENALNEIRILASISDPFIVSFKESFFDDASGCLYIVMEFLGGGTLQQKIQSHTKILQYFEEGRLWSYIYQLVKGLKTLHDLKVHHRDLKCANVFLSRDQETLKIGDMNVSKVAKQGFLSTQTGTPYYASPEIWKDEPYDLKSDVWSLGCMIYEIISLRPPFEADDMKKLFKKVVKASYAKIPSFYSKELSVLVDMCLQRKSERRPSCDELLSYICRIRKRVPDLLAPGNSIEVDFDKENELLRTIRMPKNLKNLSDILPKPSYTRVGKYSFVERARKDGKPAPGGNTALEEVSDLENRMPLIIRRATRNQTAKLEGKPEASTPLIKKGVPLNKENQPSTHVSDSFKMPKLSIAGTRQVL